MTRIKIKKCQYGKHCKHGGNINPEEEQYCLDGKKYYHPDCKKEKTRKKKKKLHNFKRVS